MKKLFIASLLFSISVTLINCSTNNDQKEEKQAIEL